MSASPGAVEFPAHCLRGLRKQSWLYQTTNGFHVHQEAFYPDEQGRLEEEYSGWKETSINWEDDEHALRFTREQKSEKGQPLNPHGVARLSLSAIEHCMANTPILNTFTRERRAIPNNRYHGNLLFDPSLPRQMLRMLAGTLALTSRLVTEGSSAGNQSAGQ